jgi:hypothetical protein
MNEEPENDEFDDEDADALLEGDGDGDEIDVDRALRAIEQSRRKAPKGADPAWRKLERLREERMTAELLMDLEDYDIGVDDDQDSGATDAAEDDESPSFEDIEPRRVQFG